MRAQVRGELEKERKSDQKPEGAERISAISQTKESANEVRGGRKIDVLIKGLGRKKHGSSTEKKIDTRKKKHEGRKPPKVSGPIVGVKGSFRYLQRERDTGSKGENLICAWPARGGGGVVWGGGGGGGGLGGWGLGGGGWGGVGGGTFI